MKYDTETVLLVAIFQKTNPLEPQSSVADYLSDFGYEVYRVGSVLQFLGLAKESNESDLGWVTNHRFMRIIAEKATRPFQAGGKIVVSKEDREFVASIYHLATGDSINDDSMETPDFCCNVLAILDLLEKGEGEDGGFKPTPRIKDLVLEHFLKVAVEEEEKPEEDEDDEDDDGKEDDDEEDDEAHSGYRQTSGSQTPSPFCVPSMNGSLEAKVLYPARWWPRDSGTEGLRGASGAHREVGPESDG